MISRPIRLLWVLWEAVVASRTRPSNVYLYRGIATRSTPPTPSVQLVNWLMLKSEASATDNFSHPFVDWAIDVRDTDGQTALMRVVKHGDQGTARLLPS